jgi:ABC-type dipeptide/oligopeptide/nickel transport system permease component
MLAFIIRRLGQALLVLMAVGFVSFAMFKFMGDPLESMLGQEATAADRAELEERLGLNDPIIVQYVRYFQRAMSGDFGVSYRVGLPVGEVILERLPATLELAFLSGVIAISLGFVAGGLYGHPTRWLCRQLHHDRLADRRVASNLPDRRFPDLAVRGRILAGCPPSGAATPAACSGSTWLF